MKIEDLTMPSTPFRLPSIPNFTLPTFIAMVGKKLPQWPHTLAFVAGLNTLVKAKLLSEDSLALLEGRSFLIDILDTGNCILFSFHGGLFRPLFTVPENPDLIFRANLSAFLQLALRQEDPDTLFFNRTLVIEGDTELGLVVKNMVDAMEWPKFFSANLSGSVSV